MMQKKPEKLLKPWHIGTHLRVLKSLRPCTLDESSLSIERVKGCKEATGPMELWPLSPAGLCSKSLGYFNSLMLGSSSGTLCLDL